MKILDLHTHLPAPKPGAIISASPEDIEKALRIESSMCRASDVFTGQTNCESDIDANDGLSKAGDSVCNQLWSVGYHPWEIGISGLLPEQIERLTRIASLPQVVAIGETGIDNARRGVPLFAQINAFLSHIKVAASVGKPLIIHSVHAHDVVVQLLRDAGVDRGEIRAVIHGFRGKPSIAGIYLKHGIGLSYGDHFNAESLAITPLEMMYAETDESSLTIDEIIERLRTADPRVSKEQLAANAGKIAGYMPEFTGILQ